MSCDGIGIKSDEPTLCDLEGVAQSSNLAIIDVVCLHSVCPCGTHLPDA